MKLIDIQSVLNEDSSTETQNLQTKLTATQQRMLALEKEWDNVVNELNIPGNQARINTASSLYNNYKIMISGTGAAVAAEKIYDTFKEQLRNSTDKKEQRQILQHIHSIEDKWRKLPIAKKIWIGGAHNIILIGKKIDENKNLLKVVEEYNNLDVIRKKLKTALNKKHKEVGQEILAADKGKEANLVPIDPANIPPRIKTPLKTSLDNPYLKYTKDRYAGPPSGFNWNRHLKSYVIVSKALKRNNLPSIDNVYAGSKSFIATAGDSVLWQHKEGQMSSRNILFIKGVNDTIHIPTFIELTDQQQDDKLQGK